MGAELPKEEEEMRNVPEEELVNHPHHYNAHPSGVECIDVIESMPVCTAMVFKYLWRAGQKGSEPSPRDYNKALWYLLRQMKYSGIELTVEGVTLDGVQSVRRRVKGAPMPVAKAELPR